MSPQHTYTVGVTWTGAGETGTSSYMAYSRDHDVRIGTKPVILGSSDPALRGDPNRINPEELFVAALAECHMLWFLHLAAQADVVVTGYEDRAVGTLRTEAAGNGHFTEIVLRPRVTVDGAAINDELLARLHRSAHDHCTIARSVSVPVHIRPVPLAAVHERIGVDA
jgi:organic hydroperoxide reductase OsmC/OhrA